MTTTAPAGNNKLLIALIAVGAALLVTVVVIVVLLAAQGRDNDINNASQKEPKPSSDASLSTPSAEPIDEPADEPQEPADTSVRFTSFDANPNVECDPTGEMEKPSPSISWSSANAVAVYWTPNDNDATADNGYSVGASGNQDDMSASKGAGERYEFPCNHEQTFDTTITLVGADGSTVSKHVTFTDVNWGSGGGGDD